MKINYLFFLLLFFLFSCTEEFLIKDYKNEKRLIVEGFITNNSEFNTVKLSYSSSTENPAKLPCTNCKVTIIDNHGNSEILTEVENGKYITSGASITGVIGNKYRLEINTPEGKEYSSELQEMKEVIGIDSVYAKEDKEQIYEYPYLLPGFQFYINTSFAQTNDNYFLWTITETYEYDIDNELKYVEVSNGVFIYNPITYDSLKTCWKTESVKSFFTGETQYLESSFILNKKLHFVDTKTKKLTKRYSINVNQFIINKNAHLYWKTIETQIYSDDIFNTTQPFNLIGNIKNKNNPNEIVLGYFTVASVYSKRIFVNRPRAFFYYPVCYVVTGTKMTDYRRTHPTPYFYVKVPGNEYGMITYSCIDCRTQGGDIYKPSFWVP